MEATVPMEATLCETRGFLKEFEEALLAADRLFALLQPGGFYARPIPLRHQCIFYYGHLPAFTWNQVFRGALGRPSFKPEFDLLFERGIDPPDMGTAPAASPEW